MRIRTFLSISCVVATTFLSAQAFAETKTLLIDRVRAERSYTLPARGMTMAQVERRFGAPVSRLAPAGGDTRRHPTINRWVYPAYTVYFERTRVIDSVLNQAAPQEIGPSNAVRGQ